MHTSPVSACAIVSPAAQVHAYKRRGYTGIIITDHFVNGNTGCPRNLSWSKKMEFFSNAYVKAKKAGDSCGLDVFFGWEYSIHGSDFLTYGLSIDFLLAHPEIERMDIEEYSAIIRSSGGYIAQAHPYRTGEWIASPYPVSPCLLDGVEVFNASIAEHFNKKALDFACEHGLAMQAGSDSHSENLHFASGIVLQKKAESIHDIINALKMKQAKLILLE